MLDARRPKPAPSSEGRSILPWFDPAGGLPSSRPQETQADARSGGQDRSRSGRPKGLVLTPASTTARSIDRGLTDFRASFLLLPFTSCDRLRRVHCSLRGRLELAASWSSKVSAPKCSTRDRTRRKKNRAVTETRPGRDDVSPRRQRMGLIDGGEVMPSQEPARPSSGTARPSSTCDAG
jgi:hypothetical protein